MIQEAVQKEKTHFMHDLMHSQKFEKDSSYIMNNTLVEKPILYMPHLKI